MNLQFAMNQITYAMRPTSDYSHCLEASFVSMSKTVNKSLTKQYCKCYTNDINQHILELDDDSSNEMEIYKLLKELSRPPCSIFSLSKIDIPLGTITHFTADSILHTSFWDIGFQIQYRQSYHMNNNFQSNVSKTKSHIPT